MAPPKKRPVSPSAEKSAPQKKKKSNDDEGDDAEHDELQGQPVASTSKQTSKVVSKEQTAPVVDELVKLETAGKAISAQTEKGLTKPKNKDMESDWEETLAQALVREPAFHILMKNPISTEFVMIRHHFYASVILSFRYIRYQTFQSWRRNFLNKARPNMPTHKDIIVDRAKEIHEEVFGTALTSTTQTVVEPPPHDADADQLRKSIFRLSTIRQRMMETIRAIKGLEYHLAKRLTNQTLLRGKPENVSLCESIIGELQDLDAIKRALRQILRDSKALASGRKLIRDMLNNLPYNGAIQLWEVSAGDEDQILEAKVPVSDVSRPESAEYEAVRVNELVQAVDNLHPFTVQYLPGEGRGRSDIVFTRAPSQTPTYHAIDMSKESIFDSKLQVEDNAVSKGLDAAAKKVGSQRFGNNQKFFEGIVTRPAMLAKASATSDVWKEASKDRRVAVVQDNLFHVRALVSIMKRENLLEKDANGNVNLDWLQETLRKMWAVVSLAFGCVPEGSLLLIVMDGLLEQLAAQIIGQMETQAPTISMSRLTDILKRAQTVSIVDQDLPAPVGEAQINLMERHERARRLFAELARFYRGAVLLAFAAVSWGAHTSGPNMKEWYESLVGWSQECGSESCMEKLEVWAPRQHQFRKFGLSVGVKDGRLGFPEERTEISQNRLYAYPCLYELIHQNKYHPGYGPFFHYFAHLYHTACQPHRGKDNLVKALSGYAESGTGHGYT